MVTVAEFSADLKRHSLTTLGAWHKIDLHNHTPASFDYQDRTPEAARKIAERINSTGLSVIMFTDHEQLPDNNFIAEVRKHTQALIIKGAEVNVFVDALDKKVGKNYYYHLLIGFDPSASPSPEYWIEHLAHEGKQEIRNNGQQDIRGFPSLEKIAEVLKDSDAIIIPAHLHSVNDPTKSRSIDDIYNDDVFLQHVRSTFTALEVTDPRTAAFFDGSHVETDKVLKSCIQSSDSHSPEKVGWRPSYALMEKLEYRELKAALQMPWRISITEPETPASYVIGMRIQGQFFPDLHISFSPHCNVLIAAKGSGKTSVLECLRFVLGAQVPQSRQESVQQQLSHVLGSVGKVTALVKRADGAKVMVERSLIDQTFALTFEDGRVEQLSSADGLLFPTQILGWHEIEQAASDRKVRRIYMDAIAGPQKVTALENQAKVFAAAIKEGHGMASQRYMQYRALDRQVRQLEERRRGLQILSDAHLIDLRDQFQLAHEQRTFALQLTQQVAHAGHLVQAQLAQLLPPQDLVMLEKDSPLTKSLAPSVEAARTAQSAVQQVGQQVYQHLTTAVSVMTQQHTEVERQFQVFMTSYSMRMATLTSEERALLESHQQVLVETQQLGTLQEQRDRFRIETTQALNDLTRLCEQLADTLRSRSELRASAIELLNSKLQVYGVKLSLLPQELSESFDVLTNSYRQGAANINQLRNKFPGERLLHRTLHQAYASMLSNFGEESGSLLFDSGELWYFLDDYEDDDLKIEFKVGKAGQEFSPIDQMSAGQRCTAVFPILLQLDRGPLIVDQPEDNLDNRYIASSIAPALLVDKRQRQMMFTSHNANLVVLSDTEAIIVFESDGATGRVEAQGFLSTRASEIAHHVIDILDGGDQALQQRALKYGLGSVR